MSNENWITVKKGNPCPICEKTSWCAVSVDGNVCVCMRMVGGVKKITFDRTGDIGYLYRLAEDDRPIMRTPRRPVRAPTMKLSKQQVRDLCCEYRRRLKTEDMHELVYRLGVTRDALDSLEVGLVRAGLYSFPMRDGRKVSIGIRFRSLYGKKKYLCEIGSFQGVFVPDEMLHVGPLYVVEGPTDVAAIYDLGFDVIGRPSCSACDDIVAAYCVKREVVIVADDDEPGYRGALKLAAAIVRPASWVKIVTPVCSKDVRQWIRDGGDRELMDVLVQQAPLYVEDRTCKVQRL